jgi:hypothetical protein
MREMGRLLVGGMESAPAIAPQVCARLKQFSLFCLNTPGEDKQAFTIEKVDQWVDALLPVFRACGSQQKQGHPLK